MTTFENERARRVMDDYPFMTILGYAPVFHPKTGHLSGFQNATLLRCVGSTIKDTWLAFRGDIPADATVVRDKDHHWIEFPSATTAAKYLVHNPI